jgi:hypothetical protein
VFAKDQNATHATTEIIHATKGGRHHSNLLKSTVFGHLIASNACHYIIRFFSNIGACKSKDYILLLSNRAVGENIRRGLNPTGRGYG